MHPLNFGRELNPVPPAKFQRRDFMTEGAIHVLHYLPCYKFLTLALLRKISAETFSKAILCEKTSDIGKEKLPVKKNHLGIFFNRRDDLFFSSQQSCKLIERLLVCV